MNHRACQGSHARPDPGHSTGGPGTYFAGHPVGFRLSLAGAAGTALYATLRAVRTPGLRRVPWTALAIVEAAITLGIMNARRAATSCGRGENEPTAQDQPQRGRRGHRRGACARRFIGRAT